MSENLEPSDAISLIPLSCHGLCEAVIITDMSTFKSGVSVVTAGVGRTPRRMTSIPADVNPAIIAASSISPERRVSRPMATRRSLLQTSCPAAVASLRANSAVIG